MKKIICIIMIFFSFSVFAEQKNNTWKSPENKIAVKIMKLQNSILKILLKKSHFTVHREVED